MVERSRRWRTDARAAAVAVALGALAVAGCWWALAGGRRAGDAVAVEREVPVPVPADAAELVPAAAPVTPTEAPEVEPRNEPADEEVASQASVAPPGPRTPVQRERTSTAVLVRVVDEAGVPTPGVAFVLHAGQDHLAVTGDEGTCRFPLPARVDGDLVLEVASTPPGRIVRPRTQRLEPPHPDLRRVDLVATPWPPPVAGDVSGTLVSELGTWPAARFFDEPDTLILELVTHVEWDPRAHLDPPPRVERRAVLEPRELDDGTRELTFTFADVPEGAYELTLSTLDPYPWSATSLFVEPPTTGLELVRYDATRTRTLGFRVLDAATGEPVDAFEAWRIEQSTSATNGVFLHAGPFPTQAVPLAGPVRWSLHAEGFAPAFGDERAFDTETDDGRLVATVRLERGWAQQLCVMGPQPSMAPLAGVAVALDGDWQPGRTDEAGLIVVRARELPTEVEFDLGGWRVDRGELLPLDSFAARRRGFVAPFVLVPR